MELILAAFLSGLSVIINPFDGETYPTTTATVFSSAARATQNQVVSVDGNDSGSSCRLDALSNTAVANGRVSGVWHDQKPLEEPENRKSKTFRNRKSELANEYGAGVASDEESTVNGRRDSRIRIKDRAEHFDVPPAYTH